MTEVLYVIWIILLIPLLLGGAFLNLLGLAGNWILLGAMIGHYFLGLNAGITQVQLSTLLVLLILAVTGEVMEFASGVAGAGKAGGSKRGVLLSFIGSLIAAGFGFGLGNAVVPLLGGIVGIVLFGALGALLGAVLGERWKGKDMNESMDVGRGAFVGRLIGTLSKSFVGAAMLTVSLGALML